MKYEKVLSRPLNAASPGATVRVLKEFSIADEEETMVMSRGARRRVVAGALGACAVAGAAVAGPAQASVAEASGLPAAVHLAGGQLALGHGSAAGHDPAQTVFATDWRSAPLPQVWGRHHWWRHHHLWHHWWWW
jgi:hypothetical protein